MGQCGTGVYRADLAVQEPPPSCTRSLSCPVKRSRATDSINSGLMAGEASSRYRPTGQDKPRRKSVRAEFERLRRDNSEPRASPRLDRIHGGASANLSVRSLPSDSEEDRQAVARRRHLSQRDSSKAEAHGDGRIRGIPLFIECKRTSSQKRI